MIFRDDTYSLQSARERWAVKVTALFFVTCFLIYIVGCIDWLYLQLGGGRLCILSLFSLSLQSPLSLFVGLMCLYFFFVLLAYAWGSFFLWQLRREGYLFFFFVFFFTVIIGLVVIPYFAFKQEVGGTLIFILILCVEFLLAKAISRFVVSGVLV